MAMDETTQQNAALVEEAAAASQAIVEQAQTLNALIAHYRLDGEPAAAPAAPVERRSKDRPWSKPAARRKAAGVDAEWNEF
jgi:methyl-accepting chemotaxis protein